MRDDLLLYYERELDYLRKMGVHFAAKHPKVASRLVLESTKCEDPHVERLLEAFAFIAARIHLKIADDFPEISDALLTVVYPQLTRPIPSMSVVEFQPDPEKGKMSSGQTIPRNTPLHSRPVGGVPCTFRLCYDTTLWPVSVTAAEWKTPGRLQPPINAGSAAGAVRIALRCAPDVTFQDLKIDFLRFYLDGESGLINSLYELLFCKLNRIVVRDGNPNSKLPPITLPPSALRAVGFDDDEAMIPQDRRSFSGHRLLMEYFSFPDKFFFIDVTGLQAIQQAGFRDAAEIVLIIADQDNPRLADRLEQEVSATTFKLGCAPIINLFSQVAEPIQLSQRKYEYQIVPDVRRPYATEVFSVDEVSSINTGDQQITVLEPFYSLRHSAGGRTGQGFWLARRRPASRPNDEGSDMFVSIVDLASNSLQPDANILSIRTTCTNRDLPPRLPFGRGDGDFELEGVSSLKRIVALRKPTPTIRPSMRKSTLWRLISHLSLNYLSLVESDASGGPQGKDALQEILRLYDFGRTPYSENVIDSIVGVRSRRHFARVSSDEGITFARGMRIDIELDEDRLTGGGPFLFASVLERFLALSASLNSFTQLAVTTRQRKDVLHEWQPRAGRKILV
jgi:type VI secretion system protein ImpG